MEIKERKGRVKEGEKEGKRKGGGKGKEGDKEKGGG